jgi:surface antigen
MSQVGGHPFTDAQLAAFLDGTLEDDALLEAIEAAINADPALADRVEALASGDDPAALAVRDAFAPVLSAPVPEKLTQIVAVPESAQVVDFAAARSARTLPKSANDTAGGWRWPQFGAMAASLALGVLIGGPLLTGGDNAPTGGSLVLASADVDAMLDTAPSGQAVDLAALGTGEVVLTFRNADGALCRQFMIEAGGGTSDALACAGADGDWQVEAYGRRAAPVGEMKLAGGDAAPAVVAAVDAMIDSDVLIGADELAELKAK